VPHPDTLAAHAGEPDRDLGEAPITPDISVGSASTYADLESLEKAMAAPRGYGRYGTANHRQLEQAVAQLEGQSSPGKVEAQAVSSGMAAIAAALLTEAGSGDHIVAGRDCYGTTLTFLRDDLARLGIATTFVDMQEPAGVEAAVTGRTRAILCEICTNPMIRVPDLEELARIAHRAGALLMVDNTVPTPALCQPFRWGADVVIHSATKNLSGHADVIGGLVLGRPAWLEGARSLVRTFGTTLGPFEAWLTLRGIRTLAVRMERHSANAAAMAAHLESHPAVESVQYPLLPGSPHLERSRRLLPNGAGALFSFELKGGREAVQTLVQRLQLIRLMPSLGHVATTISYPASTSHRGLQPAELERAGISQGLVRCSAGLERVDDLLADVDQALS
jgi:methionine-gamma-lyase